MAATDWLGIWLPAWNSHRGDCRRAKGGNPRPTSSVSACDDSMMKNLLKFTFTGVVAGVVMGWLLSLVSGDVFVVLFVGTLGLLVGMILGIVHRNDR